MRQTTRLGRYQLIDRIAYGGMAELFRAVTYEADGYRRDVAVKKLLPHFAEDSQFLVMLIDEFKVVSHLRHPNIAEVYELAQVGDSLLIAMEYVDGKDLRSTAERAIRRKQPLGFAHVAYIIAKALEGLQHAHVACDEGGRPLRIVHRDFNPSNILLGYDGRVKICDFGIAKATHNRVHTKTGVIKGKVKYMSPEQAFGKKLDHRSDIFSTGSMLYELCTGQPPFHSENEIDLIFAVREARSVPCRQVNPDIPSTLARIIDRAMSRPRSDRYPSAELFRQDLLRYLQQENPQYSRSLLSGLMRGLWEKEIEEELRGLEDLEYDLSADADLGTNLLAESMGPDASYARFTPQASQLEDIEKAAGRVSLDRQSTDQMTAPMRRSSGSPSATYPEAHWQAKPLDGESTSRDEAVTKVHDHRRRRKDDPAK